MKLEDILNCPSGYDRIQYPSIAHIVVAEDRVAEFESPADGNSQIRVLGREEIDDGVILRVGCTSNAVRMKLLSIMDGDSTSNF